VDAAVSGIRMPARLQILSLLVGLSVLWMTSEGGVEVLCLIVVIMAWVLLSWISESRSVVVTAL
jgi:hypothetical protein